jgi:tetratricopeptide (TPR) repeat protein
MSWKLRTTNRKRFAMRRAPAASDTQDLPKPSHVHKLSAWLYGLVFVIITVFAYQPTWRGTPIWDDDAHITSPELRSVDGLRRIWMEPGATQQYYPVTHTAFWVEHLIWGDSPLGYHLTNILLHCLCALLLWRILRRLEIPGAWLAAAIFSLHPVQVESVAWISELKNTLSGGLYFGSALAYLNFDRSRKLGPYASALVLFGLGLLSKTVIATLPAALLVIFWWKRGALSFRRDVSPLIPFFLVGIATAVFTAWMEQNIVGAKGSEFNFTLLERFLMAGRVVWFYLFKLLWPQNLTFIYPRWHLSQTIWWQYLFAFSLACMLAIFVWLSRKWRGPLAGALFFIGTLFPVLGFFNVYPFRYSLVADHFQYLACLGSIVPCAAGIALLIGHLLGRARFAGTQIIRLAGYAPIILLLGSLAVLSWRQSTMYTDVKTLWQTTIARNPTAWMAHNNLGAVLLKEGQTNDGIAHFQRALEIRPDEPSAHINLGDALLKKGELDSAIDHYQKALEIKPNDAGAHYNLANALVFKQQIEPAIAQYEEALRLNPNNANAHNNLGIILFQRGQLEEAVDQYQRALEINPQDILARANLAWALATTPQTSLRKAIAIKLAEQADALSGGKNPAILRVLAAAYAQSGDFSRAIETAQHALEIADETKAAVAASLPTEIDLYEKGLPYRQEQR